MMMQENVHTEELEVSIFKGGNFTKRLQTSIKHKKTFKIQTKICQKWLVLSQNSWLHINTYVAGEEGLFLVLAVFELDMNELKVEVLLVEGEEDSPGGSGSSVSENFDTCH